MPPRCGTICDAPGSGRFSPGYGRAMTSTPLAIPDDATRFSVVLLKQRDRDLFLVQKRARFLGTSYPGRLGLFGGRQDPGETPDGCAIREVKEEAGLRLRAADLLLLGRMLGYDDRGRLGFGHVYAVDTLSADDVGAARRFRCVEGRTVALSRADIGRRVAALTAISLYALSAYQDLAAPRRRDR